MKIALQSPRIKLPASALLTEEAFNDWIANVAIETTLSDIQLSEELIN